MASRPAPARTCPTRRRSTSSSWAARPAASERRTRRVPKAAAMSAAGGEGDERPGRRRAVDVERQYRLGEKKFRLIADTSAVTRAGMRPPSSATTIAKAMNTKAGFEAGVAVRSGIGQRRAPPRPAPQRDHGPMPIFTAPCLTPRSIAIRVRRDAEDRGSARAACRRARGSSEHVHARLAEHAELAALGVLLDEPAHRRLVELARLGHAAAPGTARRPG